MPLALTLAAIVQSMVALPGATACSCLPKPPPCEHYSKVPLVFIGTVTKVLVTNQHGRVVRVRMRVDRAYKGVRESSLILRDDGMCDGPDLQLGQQYLMYTFRPEAGDIPSRGCTRSRHLKYAAEDLKFLNSLAAGPLVPHVYGRVQRRSIVDYGPDQPLPGVQVQLTGPAGSRVTTTDAGGTYRFDDLQPETYTVTAISKDYRMTYFPLGHGPTVTVAPHSCAFAIILMESTRQDAVGLSVIR